MVGWEGCGGEACRGDSVEGGEGEEDEMSVGGKLMDWERVEECCRVSETPSLTETRSLTASSSPPWTRESPTSDGCSLSATLSVLKSDDQLCSTPMLLRPGLDGVAALMALAALAGLAGSTCPDGSVDSAMLGTSISAVGACRTIEVSGVGSILSLAELVIDKPCSACEICSTGYSAASCGCNVGSRA